ncbi:zinc finger BED domain-containing protein RICESLEEPER 2 [Tanacetum coccineum]
MGKRKSVTSTTPKGKKVKAERKEKFEWWQYYEVLYEKDEDGNRRKIAKCKYCETRLVADNGTSTLRKHITQSCKQNPTRLEDKQGTLQFKLDNSVEGGTSSVATWKHDDDRIYKALIKLFVIGELPFAFVKNEAFVEYTQALNARFVLPSRHKLSRDVMKFYIDERNKLKGYLSKKTSTVHFTTDTWTSHCQRINYMVVTAHFIDDEWVMHKRIINFIPINSHKGDDIGRKLLTCITEWGLKNVMTIAVDNASTNNKALDYLVRHLPPMYDGGKHFQIRCFAHILNLIVKKGLTEFSNPIERVTKAVRYIKFSTQRSTKFKKCVVDSKLQTDRFLVSDCVTRWNSTYEMLKVAHELKDAFYLYDARHSEYSNDLEEVPNYNHFEVCEGMIQFLEKFKVKTENMSASTKPLSHLFFGEILDVDNHIRKWQSKPTYKIMASKMKQKYDDYWGKLEEINDFMYFAVLLDPTKKCHLLAHGFRKIISYDITKEKPMSNKELESKVEDMVEEVKTKMGELFRTYKEMFDFLSSSSSMGEDSEFEITSLNHEDNDFLNDYYNFDATSSYETETELDRYLKEPKIELHKGQSLDILQWWKVNGPRFPIVAKIARDILAIQISTVASEAAFSIGGRVLDPYRTRLSTTIVEALICTQDCVRKLRTQINWDDVEDLIKDDEIVKDMEEQLEKPTGRDKEKQTICALNPDLFPNKPFSPFDMNLEYDLRSDQIEKKLLENKKEPKEKEEADEDGIVCAICQSTDIDSLNLIVLCDGLETELMLEEKFRDLCEDVSNFAKESEDVVKEVERLSCKDVAKETVRLLRRGQKRDLYNMTRLQMMVNESHLSIREKHTFVSKMNLGTIG